MLAREFGSTRQSMLLERLDRYIESAQALPLGNKSIYTMHRFHPSIHSAPAVGSIRFKVSSFSYFFLPDFIIYTALHCKI